VAVEALLAYAIIAAPRTLWPIRNGGNEALLYVVVLGYLFVAGGGAWVSTAGGRRGGRTGR
jgi:uncharacterized membrane protein YphA (DoxX/SURF4 family)